MALAGAVAGAVVVGAAGIGTATLLTDSATAAADDRALFCSDFVTNEKASWQPGKTLAKWAAANPGEVSRWSTFADGICAGENPAPGAVATLHGLTLVAAGRMALDEEPPPTTTGTTTTTTTTDTTTTTTTEPPPAGEVLQPGASLDAAYDGADCGDVFELAAGSWPSQSLTGTKDCPGNPVVFREADGARVIVDSLNVDGADHITFSGFETGYQDADHQHGIHAGPGSSFIRFENIDAGNVGTWFASDITVLGGDYGPCRAPASGCWLNNIDVSDRVTIDGALFHDYNYLPACVQSADCHWRPLFVNGARGFTLRNSTFRNSVFEPWTTISGPDAGQRGNHDILIENNQFGSAVQSPSATNGGFGFAWCQNAVQPAYRNVTIRFNSFAVGAFTGPPDTVSSSGTCRVENFRLHGNVLRFPFACGLTGPGTNIGTPEWSHNVFTGSTNRTCGTGDQWIGGSAHPFYTNDTPAPAPGDYDLDEDFAGVNRVPAALCNGTDAKGDTRDVSDGFCDAGAFER